MGNFTCEICPISNTTLVVFIPNFTATHAITYTNFIGTSLSEFHTSKLFCAIGICVLAWVAVKFGINSYQSAVLEMGRISQGEAE